MPSEPPLRPAATPSPDLSGIRLRPGPSVRSTDRPDTFLCAGDASFILEGDLPKGWVELAYRLVGPARGRGSLYLDTGVGFTEAARLPLPLPERGLVRAILFLPPQLRSLRLQPAEGGEPCRLIFLGVRRLTRWQAAYRLLQREWSNRSLALLVEEGYQALKGRGPAGLRQLLFEFYRRSLSGGDPTDRVAYGHWIEQFDRLRAEDVAAISAHIARLPWKPTISVLMPVYNVEERWLRAAIESVRAQLYPYWELCIADDASTAAHIRPILEEYAHQDPRIKVVFRRQRGHISACSNEALALASGEYLALFDHDDLLAPHALYHVVAELERHPEAVLLYSDYDKVDEDGNRYDPFFKPDWNPDLILGLNLVAHLDVYRTDVVRRLGGFRLGYEGAQDYDLALRVVERTRPEDIRHIPFILYHWRAIPGSAAHSVDAKPYAYLAARRAIQDFFDRRSIPATSVAVAGHFWFHRPVFALPPEPPMVSVIIPTRDRLELLSRCIDGLRRSRYPRKEILVVDNQSREPATHRYLDSLKRTGVRVLPFPRPFNYSAMNNLAAETAQGEYLLLLNNDVEPLNDDWLEEMVSQALRPEVGIVGALLYYPNRTIQHAGVILGLGGIAGHVGVGAPEASPGYFGRHLLVQNVTAVTGACLLIRRQLFLAVGGLDEELPVAFNDIDLCLKVRGQGYRITWTPYARLIHHESATRGHEDTPEKQRRFERECLRMRRRWGDQLDRDPCYSPNLSLSAAYTLAYPPRVERPWRVRLEGLNRLADQP